MNPTALCWIDGDILPAAEATVSVFDHGLLYGDGVFEGLRFYRGVTFKLEAHLQRLQASADGIAARVIDMTGRVVRLQTGYVYHYAFAMMIGVALITVYFMFQSGGLLK